MEGGRQGEVRGPRTVRWDGGGWLGVGESSEAAATVVQAGMKAGKNYTVIFERSKLVPCTILTFEIDSRRGQSDWRLINEISAHFYQNFNKNMILFTFCYSIA